MEWHIGQEIVCVKSHSEREVKRGEICKIHALKGSCCGVLIDIGRKDKIKADTYITICRCGNEIHNGANSTLWFHESLFQPLEYNKEAIEELLEQKIST